MSSMSSKVVTKSVKNTAVEKYKEMIKIAYIKKMAAELAAKQLATKQEKTKKNTKLAPVEEDEDFDEDEYSRRLDEYFDNDYDY